MTIYTCYQDDPSFPEDQGTHKAWQADASETPGEVSISQLLEIWLELEPCQGKTKREKQVNHSGFASRLYALQILARLKAALGW